MSYQNRHEGGFSPQGHKLYDYHSNQYENFNHTNSNEENPAIKIKNNEYEKSNMAFSSPLNGSLKQLKTNSIIIQIQEIVKVQQNQIINNPYFSFFPHNKISFHI